MNSESNLDSILAGISEISQKENRKTFPCDCKFSGEGCIGQGVYPIPQLLATVNRDASSGE